MENAHFKTRWKGSAWLKDEAVSFTEKYLASLGMETKVWSSDKETLISGKKILCEVGVKIVIDGDDLLVGVGKGLWKNYGKGSVIGLLHPISGIMILGKVAKDFLVYEDVNKKVGEFIWGKEWDSICAGKSHYRR